jgi:hypothetical protein
MRGRNANSFHGCTFEDNEAEGVLIDSSTERFHVHAPAFYSCWFEGNRYAQLRTSGEQPIVSLSVLNCIFQDAKAEEDVHVSLGGQLHGGQIGPNVYRARRNTGVETPMHDIEIPFGAAVRAAVVGANSDKCRVDPDASAEILWLGDTSATSNFGAIGVGTAAPPAPDSLVVGGTARFASVGSGLISGNQLVAYVDDPHVGPESHIMVTLRDDPGAGQSISWVENRYADGIPGFAVVLDRPVDADTRFTYFIVN